MSPSTRAILFDFGGTLDAPGEPWKERLFELYRSEGVAMTPSEFAPFFYRADDQLVGTVGRTLSFADTVYRLVDGVSAALAIADRALIGRVAAAFIDNTLAYVHESRRVLARLAPAYRLGVVSNFYGNLAAVCDDLGLAKDLSVMVDSCVVGCTKPDARIFACALDELRVAPAEALFVGDSLLRDMAGARDVGMPHVWLAPAERRQGEACCADDRVIASLTELSDSLVR